MPVDHYENFPVASCLLPRRLRRPIEAIYRFARAADDIADEGDADSAARLRDLAVYRAQIDGMARGETPADGALAELAWAVREWRLPTSLLSDLLDAFAQDVVKKRYADYPELLDYCRRSANPVGRLLLHLVGRTEPEHLRRSDCICTALQLINFWQDIAVDWQKGRVYVPQTDLQRFAVRESQIAAAVCDDNWAALLDFETERTRQLLIDGASLASQLPGRMAWEIRFTVQGGLRILERLRSRRGDVFRHRPVLGPGDWLRVAGRAVSMSVIRATPSRG